MLLVQLKLLVCFNMLINSFFYQLSEWLHVLQEAVMIDTCKESETASYWSDPVEIHDTKQSVKEFKAILQRNADSGFGIVIAQKSEKVFVKKVKPSVLIKSIHPEDFETVKCGDHVLKINDQDVHDWTVADIIEYMNGENMKASATAQILFSRALPLMRPLNLHVSPLEALPSPRTVKSRSHSMSLPETPREVFFLTHSYTDLILFLL